MTIQILPVTGIGDVRPGYDLAALIAAAAPWLADGDVLVVTSKIVSKAEGRLVDVPLNGPDREAARDGPARALHDAQDAGLTAVCLDLGREPPLNQADAGAHR